MRYAPKLVQRRSPVNKNGAKRWNNWNVATVGTHPSDDDETARILERPSFVEPFIPNPFEARQLLYYNHVIQKGGSILCL